MIEAARRRNPGVPFAVAAASRSTSRRSRSTRPLPALVLPPGRPRRLLPPRRRLHAAQVRVRLPAARPRPADRARPARGGLLDGRAAPVLPAAAPALPGLRRRSSPRSSAPGRWRRSSPAATGGSSAPPRREACRRRRAAMIALLRANQRRLVAIVGVYGSAALGIAGTLARVPRPRADRGGALLDRDRGRPVPVAADLADERRGAREVRLPLRDARGLGPLPPARAAHLRVRARGVADRRRPDRRARAVRRLDLHRRRRPRGADPDRGAAAAAAGDRVDRGGGADPARALRPPRPLAHVLDGAEVRRARGRGAARGDRGGARRRRRAGADHRVDPGRRLRRPAALPARRAEAARGRRAGRSAASSCRARPTPG